MSSPISGIGAIASSLPAVGVGANTGITGATGVGTPSGTTSTSGGDFASVLSSSLDQLQATQSHADQLAQQAATGDLKDVSDYMIASNEATLATQMVVTIKNQAVNAFNEIMRMQV